ncbi:nucleotide sugar dehydrogenase [Candidatus Gracilibacteria bacterium]|nr:nucleotide sugar dehydrogenase [Candidatus Gracilibacteria bacterium]
MKVSVIGTGYVGLIQTVGLAKNGFKITALDIFEDKIKKLKSGVPTIYENGLEELLNVTLSNIDFTIDINKLKGSDIIFLCVGTPQDEEGKTDLSYIKNAVNDLKNVLSGDEIIVIKSTVPVGTNKMVYELLGSKNPVVSNPEFLREGLAIEDFFNPDRVILGFNENENSYVLKKIKEVYDYFIKKNIPIVETNWQTAELIKYAANSFLATKITFINEIARLSDKVGANIKDISKAIGIDSRIGEKFLNAGIGYGGSCFPKDVKSLIHQFKENNITPGVIEKVDYVNQTQVDYFIDKITTKYGSDLHGKTISLIGVAFKPDTDDLRESRGLLVVNKLLKMGATVKVFDYNSKALENFEKYSYSLTTGIKNYIPIIIGNSFENIVKNSDFLVITIEDKRILNENFDKLKSSLKESVIFDGKNILDKKTMQNLGFEYNGVGY